MSKLKDDVRQLGGEIHFLKSELESLTKRFLTLRESNIKLFAILESAGIIALADKKAVIIPNSDPWGWGDVVYNVKEVK